MPGRVAAQRIGAAASALDPGGPAGVAGLHRFDVLGHAPCFAGTADHGESGERRIDCPVVVHGNGAAVTGDCGRGPRCDWRDICHRDRAAALLAWYAASRQRAVDAASGRFRRGSTPPRATSSRQCSSSRHWPRQLPVLDHGYWASEVRIAAGAQSSLSCRAGCGMVCVHPRSRREG
jgi:hypothetical protein